ncbi:MAG: M23 family metallopeptidase [Gemmatimonadales bacterium]|nr:M23 family metallopeptidase [Gemmatimonadales bacterium]
MTTPRRQYVRVIVHHDGAPGSHDYALPVWAYRAILVAVGVMVLGLLGGLVMIGPLARSAMRVPSLEQEIRRLEVENGKIGQLAAALDSVGRSYDRVRQMVGADIVPDVAAAATDLLVAAPVLARAPGLRPRFAPGVTLPRYWPLDEYGFITRGLVGDSTPDESHPGLDIAITAGSIVRAAGGGTVTDAGENAEYGRYVVVGHPSGYESKYGHLSRVVVSRSETVSAGSVLGLSGSTGRSTAPHLHFEVRHGGRSIDPLILVKEAR